jgi:hypothetical protein
MPLSQEQLLPNSREKAGAPGTSVNSLARFAASSTGSLTTEPSSSVQVSPTSNISRLKCLLVESIRRADGVGPTVCLEEYHSKLLVATLRVTDVVERTGLTVSVWGSADEEDWGSKALITFRQRQYCGVYSLLLNLAAHPEVRFLRVEWAMNRWGKGERIPLFGFEVFLQESGARISSTAVA